MKLQEVRVKSWTQEEFCACITEKLREGNTKD